MTDFERGLMAHASICRETGVACRRECPPFWCALLHERLLAGRTSAAAVEAAGRAEAADATSSLQRPALRQLRTSHHYGWTLLTNAEDYAVWHAERGAYYGDPPTQYPVFVSEEFSSDGLATYRYLGLADLVVMADQAFEAKYATLPAQQNGSGRVDQ